MAGVGSAHLVTAFIGLCLLSGCTAISGTGDGDYVPGDGRVVEVPVAEREGPVDLVGETLQGARLDFTDLRGQVVVVNLWWSSCGPCRTEMPMLVEAEAELSAKDTEFVGINIRDLAPENAEAFERDLSVDYPSIYDPGSTLVDAFGRYAPYAPPTTWVLDREGRVAALINGPIPSKRTLLEVVDAVSAEEA